MKQEIKISKFGGSSMKDLTAMNRSAQVVKTHQTQMIVVSATYGTTNQLLDLINICLKSDWPPILESISKISERHLSLCQGLKGPHELSSSLHSLMDELVTLCKGIFYLKECTPKAKDRLQSIGEGLSSRLFAQALKNNLPDKEVSLLDVRDYITTNRNFTKAIPLKEITKKNCIPLEKELFNNPNKFYVTQGFIGKTLDGETTTLGRGGSDYTASILGEALNAKEIQIWTDVAGIATTDPKICKEAKRINEITFKEAAEMATFGAKILHPTTLTPAKRKGIPIFVGSSLRPDAPGTWIEENVNELPLVRAVTLKENQCLITLSNPDMLEAHGFLASIFSVFEKHDISVDAITTSEISVAMTVDMKSIENFTFIKELEKLGSMTYEKNMSLVSIIGNNINYTPGISLKIFEQLSNINIRMICQGASIHNFCFLLLKEEGKKAVNKIHKTFIQ